MHKTAALNRAPLLVSDVSESWLSDILAKRLGVPNVCIKLMVNEPLNCIAGYLSNVSRLRLIYDRPDKRLPGSLVLKVTPVFDSARRMVIRLHAFENEVRFYNEIRDRVPVNTPSCYFANYDGATGSGLLILEDVSDIPGGDQITGMKFDDASAAVRAIARVHATYWMSSDLNRITWISDCTDGKASEYRELWPSFERDFSHELSRAQNSIGRMLAEKIDRVVDLAASRAQTLIHADFRAENLRFNPGEPGSMTVLDWQLLARGSGAMDVMRLLGGSVDADFWDMLELTRIWHRELEAGGVSGYSLSAAELDMRLAALLNLHIPVFCNNELKHRGPRAQQLLDRMACGFFRTVETLECGSLLNSL